MLPWATMPPWNPSIRKVNTISEAITETITMASGLLVRSKLRRWGRATHLRNRAQTKALRIARPRASMMKTNTFNPPSDRMVDERSGSMESIKMKSR